MYVCTYHFFLNATRYNVPGGMIIVTILKDEAGVALSVKDTGLGLAIVKHIVELHDGKIEIKSKLSKGTEIKIVF